MAICMVDKTGEQDRFDWRLSFYVAAGAVIIFLPFVISSAVWGEILYLIVAVPFASIVLLILAIHQKGRQRLSVLSILIVYWAITAALEGNYSAVRDTARWSLWSKGYKSWVLAQPGSASGELKHVEWDGWGFAGAGDTTVYLVFDPNDSLAAEAKSQFPGKFSGIPCEVPRVRRLESHWYAVMFYTDTDWDHCN
jgi:hypothetical protein